MRLFRFDYIVTYTLPKYRNFILNVQTFLLLSVEFISVPAGTDVHVNEPASISNQQIKALYKCMFRVF